jgi:hypothetical protein
MTKLVLAVIFAGLGVFAFYSFPRSFRDVWYLLLTAAVWGLALSLLLSFLYDLGKGKQLN